MHEDETQDRHGDGFGGGYGDHPTARTGDRTWQASTDLAAAPARAQRLALVGMVAIAGLIAGGRAYLVLHGPADVALGSYGSNK